MYGTGLERPLVRTKIKDRTPDGAGIYQRPNSDHANGSVVAKHKDGVTSLDTLDNKELLKEIKDIKEFYHNLEAMARGYVESEYSMEDRNDIVSSMRSRAIPALIKMVKDSSDLDDYWYGHMLCFYGYTFIRASEISEAEKYLHEATEFYLEYEKDHPYPYGYPMDEISEFGAGTCFTSLLAHGLWIASLDEDRKPAAYKEGIEFARERFPDNKYFIAEMCRKAGENAPFTKEGLAYFKEGLEYIESLADIETIKSNEDDERFGTWLKLKVEYMEHLDLYPENEEDKNKVANMRQEMSQYSHLVTWRSEGNLADFE